MPAKFDWRNLPLQVLSLVLALVLWVYVSNEQNPLEQRLFSVALQGRGAPDGYLVSGLPATVSVKAQGSRTQLNAVNAGDFQAAVNLASISPGENELPVSVIPPPGIKVLQVTPAQVRVLVDRIVEKKVPVEVSLRGEPAEGYQLGNVAASPGAVVLKGPERQLSALSKVTVHLNVQGITGAVEQYVNISGLPPGVAANPQGVKVSVAAVPVPVSPGAAGPSGGQAASPGGGGQAAGAPSPGGGQTGGEKRQ